MSKKIYEMVTEKILSQLKEGVVPWHMPWRNFNSVNWKTQKPYRGINAMILVGGEYASFKPVFSIEYRPNINTSDPHIASP